MSKDIKEFYIQHRDLLSEAEFNFVSYYKYTFVFEAKVDDYTINIQIGGNAEQIYQQEVSTELPAYWKNLDPYACTITKGTEVIADIYDY